MIWFISEEEEGFSDQDYDRIMRRRQLAPSELRQIQVPKGKMYS